MKIIQRSFDTLRAADGEGRKLIGRAVVFDSWSRDLGGFKEIIHRSAISDELLASSDIIMNINHDNNQMVARWNGGNGTLSLELREDGLWFEFEAPQTERGNELLWNVRSGNLFECSFAFSLPDNKTCTRWYKDEDGLKREINEIGGLYDCAIVTFAAYPDTNVDSREKEIIDTQIIIRSLEEEEREKEKSEELIRNAEILTSLDDKRKEFLEKLNI